MVTIAANLVAFMIVVPVGVFALGLLLLGLRGLITGIVTNPIIGAALVLVVSIILLVGGIRNPWAIFAMAVVYGGFKLLSILEHKLLGKKE